MNIYNFSIPVDDGKKGNWLRKEFSYSMAVDDDFNVFQFNFFSQQWVMNIYNRFNFTWQLMMARKEIG